jgi:DNA-binding CsgD family transcriptional regulator
MNKLDASLTELRMKYEKLVLNTCIRASDRFKVTGKTSLKPEEAAPEIMNEVLFIISQKFLLDDGGLPSDGFPVKLFQALTTRKASNIFRAKFRNRNTKPFYKTQASYDSTTDSESELQIDIEDKTDQYSQLIKNDLLDSLNEKLNSREKEVLTMYLEGIQIKVIARTLSVDPRTVLNIRKRIDEKLKRLSRDCISLAAI